PMAWLYGTRARGPVTPLIAALRRELYDRPYERIDFGAHRATLAPGDTVVPVGPVLAAAQRAMGAFEAHAPRGLRQRALARIFAHLEHEDAATSRIRIGPVNAVLNTLVHWFRDGGGPRVEASFATLDGYLWDEDGRVTMNGYNSTALWDTAFAAQAILATAAATDAAPTLARAYEFLRHNQVTADVADGARHYRHPSRGGWPFSDRPHGWPISDCTAEGLKAALLLEPQAADPLPPARLCDAVGFILSLQNDDGGWATYERTRGPAWLERLNPAQVFNDIMIDYSYVECTAACVQALAAARRRFPGRFAPALDDALARGVRFLRRRQRPDGSWEGCWAVCFSYATWFGVTGLRAAGVPARDPAIARAVAYLAARPNADGGFGEHFTSCTARRWMPAASTAAQTSWALLALVHGGAAATPAAAGAAAFLLERQGADGSWPREPLVGVFNKTALINYENYRRYFPVWALGAYAAAIG
ncbi:MAG TPA: prenyltransferase/squalene oxidase repeat-containing protein, partial [Polyangia bacterium]